MLKLNFTKEELNKILDKAYFSEVQERIIVYRIRDLSIIQIADLEHCSHGIMMKMQSTPKNISYLNTTIM